VTDLSSLALAVAVLLVLLLAVGFLGRLGQNRDALVVVARAVVQLGLVGFVIRAVFVRPALAPFYLAAMVGIAAYTSSRRLRHVRLAFGSAVAAISAGATVVCLRC
jgi:ABC-type iron transport system FetAB permease component